MKIIDAHSHITGDDAAVISLLEDLNVHSLNICVGGKAGAWHQQREDFAQIAKDHPERYHWMTAFDPPDFKELDYVERVIAGLDEDFANGAIACKIWKNIGMDVQTPDGEYVQIDHEIFTPIFEHIAKCERPLLAHIGEPYACWQPLEFDSPHAGYYKGSPQWHMYGKDHMPSYDDIMSAFDRMLDRHTNLRVIGAHLGSQEYDVREIGKRMDRCPHFAVDTGARNYDLAFADRQQVYDFFEHYGDRVLFGIDMGMPHSASHDDHARAQSIKDYRFQCEEAFAFYGTDADLIMRGKDVKGLALSDDALQAFYRGNAEHWYQL